jgi:serine/threonine protein kinase
VVAVDCNVEGTVLELRKGTELEHRYVIHDVAGTGGFSAVWKASDKQLNRDVAIKRLFKSEASSASEDLTPVLAEARKNAQLIHTNIVQVYDIIDVAGEHLIVMEYVDGPSLHENLRSRARASEIIPLDQAVAILKDILSGVAFAHSKNICHRDLSPLNILITSSSIPKIADFGIARVLGETKASALSPDSGPQAGTGNPNFMSPEQARGEPADFSSDLFMVGIIGYLLLTGKHPFAHPTGLFTIPELIIDANHVPDPPKPPSNLTASEQRLYREYAAVVMRLLHRERAARFGSAREALNAIDAVTPSLECPACHERVPEHHRFCGFCGASLDKEAAAPPSAAQLSQPNLSADELVQQGFQLTRLQRWDEAIQVYRQAIAADTDFQRAYWNLGFALNRIGEYEEAIEVLKRGLALPGGHPEHLSQFYYALAFANSNLKNYEEAFEQVEEALRLQPGSLKSLYLRAKIDVYLGRIADARRDAAEILRRNPDHAAAIRLLDELPG